MEEKEKMRLIDADKAKKELKKLCEKYNITYGGTGGFSKAVAEFMDDQPAVEPVKHGKWTLTIDEDTGSEVLWCGNCKIGFVDGPERFGRPPYCPRCGAKMDGAEKG